MLTLTNKRREKSHSYGKRLAPLWLFQALFQNRFERRETRSSWYTFRHREFLHRAKPRDVTLVEKDSHANRSRGNKHELSLQRLRGAAFHVGATDTMKID